MPDSILSNPKPNPPPPPSSLPPKKPTTAAASAPSKWPGWPGDNVFRLIVPVIKVGGIIGRRGELVKRICDETKARIRVLEAPIGTPDRVVLISGQEDPDAPLSPAMDAVVRVFRIVAAIPSNDADNVGTVTETVFFSIKLLIAFPQALTLIGKQGSTIKSIQDCSGATVRVLAEDELPSYASLDERIVEIHGEVFKVLKALEAVIGHLRKFLVDHSVVAVIEKNFNATISQDHAPDAWSYSHEALDECVPPITLIRSEHSFSSRHDSLFDHEINMNREVLRPGPRHYSDDELFSRLHPAAVARSAASIVSQVTQTMQVPLLYAENIIGVLGDNIAYIRRCSGAVLTVQETPGLTDEMTIEIKGTLSQVQKAQQLVQEFLTTPRRSAAGNHASFDPVSSPHSRYSDTPCPGASYRTPFSSHPPGGYGSSGREGFSYRF